MGGPASQSAIAGAVIVSAMDTIVTIADYVRSVESRVVGRVFTYDDRLHFVLEVERETGLARLSCRYDERTEFIYMPVDEVLMRLGDECRRHAAGDVLH